MTDYTVALYTKRDQKSPTQPNPERPRLGFEVCVAQDQRLYDQIKNKSKSAKTEGDYFSCFPQNLLRLCLQTPAPGLA